MFGLTLSGGFQGGSLTKGPRIFILIVQINCFHLHTNRWAEEEDTVAFSAPESAHIDTGTGFFFLLVFFRNFSQRRGKESNANAEFEMLLAWRSQMVPACYLNISGPALKGFKDAL